VGLCVDSDHRYVGGHCDFGVITRENVGWRGVGEYGQARPTLDAMSEVGELVLSTDGQWMVRPPQRCGNGHQLAGRCIVGTLACSCGDRHLTWCCDACKHTTYGPSLGLDCSVLNGPARVR
jgi:hypothetical protein